MLVDPFLYPDTRKLYPIRKNINAYVLYNGHILIEGERFLFTSLTAAVKSWRKRNPAYPK